VRPPPGYAGALLCNNAELATEFAGKVARSVLHSVAKADAGGKAELGSSSDESLRRLSAEVRAIRRTGEGEPRLTHGCARQVAALAALVSARGSSLTVVHGSGSSSNALVLGACVVGGAAVLHMRGLGMDNLLWVSRASFRSGVSTLGAGLQSVSVALARVRSALTERLDALSGRVNEVASDVASTRAGVESLGEQLSAVEGKLDDVSQKQDFANRGVYLLCSAVSQAMSKDGSSTGPSDARDASKKLPPNTDKTLLEMLAAPSASGCSESAALMSQPLLMTGTLQEQLAAISTLAAVNLNMTVGA
jgi:hypothetical protein